MSQFALTNRQREYFGLEPVQEEWETLELKDMLVYFEGDLIRKVICYEISKDYGYQEYDYELETDSREKLLPATKRGKSKPLTPANILARKSLGFSFICYFGTRGKNFPFQHLYVTHVASDSSIVSLHDHGITTYEQLADWVDAFLNSCPPDHLQQIDEMRGRKRHRVRYQPGDIFEIRFDETETGYGKILLDIFRLRKQGFFKDKPEPYPYAGLNGPLQGCGLLVAIYSYAGPPLEPEQVAVQPVLCTRLLMHENIYDGTFPIIGNAAVLPEELDFPEGVGAWHPGDKTVEYYFLKGGLHVRISVTEEEARQAPIIGCAFGLNPESILKAIQGDASAQAHLMGDLRYSQLRAAVLAICGLSPDMTYAEMVAAKGGISPDSFIEASQKQ
ncbi:MAG: hypothetical protein KDA70_04400 [Planctomycetaceae bacterium]|nr:hypothetical protein [Planctomycetaceae bacterium]